MKLCPMPSRDTDAETTGIRCLLPPVIFQSKHPASCIINSLSHHKTFKHFPNFCSNPTAVKRCCPMAAFDYGYFQSCFEEWIAQQHQDLEELLSELSTDSVSDNEKLKLLTEKSIKHFEEYSDRRALMVQHDAPSFLSPSWCSSFENAFLWMGGCRSSLPVRLVYSVCGSELSSQLTEFLLTETKGSLISAEQLHMINTLHCKTIREEETMSTRMATLQEEIADLPMNSEGVMGESSQEMERAMDDRCLSLASIVTDADRLRLSTLKELMGILTPGQGVDLLVATNKLHLSMHEWGKKMNRQLGEKEIMITD